MSIDACCDLFRDDPFSQIYPLLGDSAIMTHVRENSKS